MAAWDVHRARVFGRCEQATGIEAYRRLVDDVMAQEPYKSARRVFWVTDNGSSHRGSASVARLTGWHPNAVQIHTPIHASWLNQVEIDFGDCYYGSGVQVGAYARPYLAYYYKEIGKEKESKVLFDEIRKDYPDAVNHKGKLLIDMLPK